MLKDTRKIQAITKLINDRLESDESTTAHPVARKADIAFLQAVANIVDDICPVCSFCLYGDYHAKQCS